MFFYIQEKLDLTRNVMRVNDLVIIKGPFGNAVQPVFPKILFYFFFLKLIFFSVFGLF
jgi:hypothetical protein